MSQSGSSESSSSNSTALIPYSREGILAAVRAESRERADALLEWLQASDNLHRRLIVGSKYSLGQHQSTPILKLHDDLLLRVFMLNADLLPVEVTDLDDNCGERDALNVTRSTSQVCEQWRELMINSPSLWGRCVDLERLNQQKPHWRNEVMRRTGGSFLHIRGSIVSLELGAFFLHLLDTSWKRIRAFQVELKPFDAIVTDPRWVVLQRPAPALQIFSLSIGDAVPNIIHTSEAPMFGGHATALVKLVLRGGAGILFKMPSSQFFQLRHLAISGSFTIPGLFKALSNMSLLEYLQVHQIPRTDTTPSTLPHIIFSRLLHLRLDSTLDSCLTMLEHVTLAPGSGLTLYCPDDDGIQIEHLTDRLLTVISPYTQSFFDSHIVSKLSMRLSRSNFLFECEADSSMSRSPPQLFFNTEKSPRPMQPEIYDAIFGIFSACQSTDISDLFIRLSPCDYTPVSAGNMSFISSFSSVETLTTTAEFLAILIAKSNDKCLFFPSLRTLKYMSYPHATPALDTIKNFLLQRQEARVPLQLLMIKISRPPSVKARQLFETFSGLRVIWVKFGRWLQGTWDQKDAEFYARLTPKDSDQWINPNSFEF